MKNIVGVIMGLLLLGSVCYAQEKKVLFKDMKKELYQNQGLWYEVKTKELFTGKVVGDGVEVGEQSEMNFKDGDKDGIELHYNLDNVLMGECMYVKGKLQGPFKEYYDTGELYKEGNYNNYLLEGIVKRYFRFGGVESVIFYKNNVQQGTGVVYHENGKVKYIDNPKDEKEVFTYNYVGTLVNTLKNSGSKSYCLISKEYFYNGNLSEVNLCHSNDYEKRDYKYYLSGQLKNDFIYTTNNDNNVLQWYYENGMLQLEQRMFLKVPNIINKDFYSNGMLKQTSEIGEDVINYHPLTGEIVGKEMDIMECLLNEKTLDGKIKFSYPNGQLMLEYTFINGRPMDGNMTIYFDNGKKFMELKIDKKSSHVIVSEYHKDGGLVKEYALHNNLLEGFQKTYGLDGVLLEESTYSKGLETPYSSKCYNNGKIMVRSYFDNDRRLLIHTTYYRDGKLAAINERDENNKCKTEKLYDEHGNLITTKTEIIKED